MDVKLEVAAGIEPAYRAFVALPARLLTPVDALQPGRRICAVRADRAGTAVPIAFMTLHVRGEPHRSVRFG